MQGTYGFDALQFLINTLITVYALVVLIRFMLQATNADFHNPVTQFVVRATAPVVGPLRRILPPVGRWDIASLVLVLALMTLKIWLYRLLSIDAVIIGGYRMFIEHVWFGGLLWLAAVDTLALVINVYFFAVLIRAILTWISPAGYNPVVEILERITAPVVNPVRRYVPLIGGIDISPLIVLIGLQVLKMLILPPLLALA